MKAYEIDDNDGRKLSAEMVLIGVNITVIFSSAIQQTMGFTRIFIEIPLFFYCRIF